MIDEILERYEAVRRAVRSAGPSAAHVDALERIVASAPTFAPAWMLLGRLLQFVDAPSVERGLERAGEALERAVEVSDRGPEALNELAHVVDAARDEPANARPLYDACIQRLLACLEDALVGRIGVAVQADDEADARRWLELAERVFPGAASIAEVRKDVDAMA